MWKGGALDDDDNVELRDIEEGDVIAEGTVGTPGYGDTPVERGQFIVRTIREHIDRARCGLHTAGRRALEARFGVEVRWCPACGAAF